MTDLRKENRCFSILPWRLGWNQDFKVDGVLTIWVLNLKLLCDINSRLERKSTAGDSYKKFHISQSTLSVSKLSFLPFHHTYHHLKAIDPAHTPWECECRVNWTIIHLLGHKLVSRSCLVVRKVKGNGQEKIFTLSKVSTLILPHYSSSCKNFLWNCLMCFNNCYGVLYMFFSVNPVTLYRFYFSLR